MAPTLILSSGREIPVNFDAKIRHFLYRLPAPTSYEITLDARQSDATMEELLALRNGDETIIKVRKQGSVGRILYGQVVLSAPQPKLTSVERVMIDSSANVELLVGKDNPVTIYSYANEQDFT